MHRALGCLAGFLYRKAGHIVVVTPAFREHLVRRWRVPARKISVVQNGVDAAKFNPHRANPELQMQAEGKFVVSYIGTLGLAHGLDTLIAAATRLQAIASDVQFLVVGDGAERERLVKIVESQQLPNVLCIPSQPRERIPEYICASDACLVMLKKSEIFETVIPTKMLEFMSCARPVILGVKGEAQRLLESCRAGISVEPEDPDALCRAILRLRDEPRLRSEMGARGRDHIVRELSREATAAEYLRVLEAALQGGVPLKKSVAA
jgi:glycosyltransferase involved in cell wall biosynthesis